VKSTVTGYQKSKSSSKLVAQSTKKQQIQLQSRITIETDRKKDRQTDKTCADKIS